MSETAAIATLESGNIQDKIYTIRGMQVMLDRDLATLYQIETRVLKQAIKRNIKRFPSDFMFVLNETEIDEMVSQSVIPSRSFFGEALPYAFTEHGIAGVSAVLNSQQAIDVRIQIMRAFVEMRKLIIGAFENQFKKIALCLEQLSSANDSISVEFYFESAFFYLDGISETINDTGNSKRVHHTKEWKKITNMSKWKTLKDEFNKQFVLEKKICKEFKNTYHNFVDQRYLAYWGLTKEKQFIMKWKRAPGKRQLLIQDKLNELIDILRDKKISPYKPDNNLWFQFKCHQDSQVPEGKIDSFPLTGNVLLEYIYHEYKRFIGEKLGDPHKR